MIKKQEKVDIVIGFFYFIIKLKKGDAKKMKKDSLIMYERNYAGHLLLILKKLKKIDKILSVKIKNKQF